MKGQKEFIWTDELVKQYGNHLFTFGTPCNEKIKQFKDYINKNKRQ